MVQGKSMHTFQHPMISVRRKASPVTQISESAWLEDRLGLSVANGTASHSSFVLMTHQISQTAIFNFTTMIFKPSINRTCKYAAVPQYLPTAFISRVSSEVRTKAGRHHKLPTHTTETSRSMVVRPSLTSQVKKSRAQAAVCCPCPLLGLCALLCLVHWH